MKYRCLNDVFAYCIGEPNLGEKKQVADSTAFSDTCIADPKTCGNYQTFTEQLAGIQFQGSGYRHTLAGKKAKEAKSG